MTSWNSSSNALTTIDQQGLIKVVYVIDKMKSSGGAQSHLLALVSKLDPDRFQPVVVCLTRGENYSDRLRDRGPTHVDRLRERGIPVRILGTKRIFGWSATKALLSFVLWLRRERSQFVHTYLSSANVFGTVAARAASVPCIYTTRRDTGFGDSRKMQHAIRFTNRWVTRVLSVSELVGKMAIGREQLAASRVVVVPNGVDLDRFARRGTRETTRAQLGIAKETPVIVTVGHLTRIKGVDLLLEAATAIRASIPDVVFLVLGSGGLHRELVDRAAELRLQDCFRLIGERSDVRELLEVADLFVLPSRSEGQPNAALEAMAVGLPIVATRVGGVPEVLRHDQDCLLVEPNRPEQIASACVEILSSPPLASRLVESGRQRVHDAFSLTDMVHRYEELYEKELMGL